MSSSPTPPLILASASPRRSELLADIGITPDHIIPADTDESMLPRELPRPYVARIALGKAAVIAAAHPDAFVLGADTIVAVGTRILPKPENAEQARAFLALMSGRAHRVYTGVCLFAPSGKVTQKTVETRLKMKRLSKLEIDTYIDSEEWRGKAGAYGIQGRAGAFIANINGSYTNVVGLPVYETRNLLTGAGYGR